MNWDKTLVGLVGVWNFVVNRLLPERHYVTANLAASGGLVVLGRLTGASAEQLGIGKSGVRRGIKGGLVGAALVGAGSAVASRLPLTGHLFNDARARSGDIGYQTMIRIPLGTVVLEEIAFRSVLPSVLDGNDRQSTSLRSAALFGLWHVLPTLKAMEINGVTDRRTQAKAVVAGVVATAAVALVFDKVRIRSRSVVAPMLIHWSANAVSYAIAAHRQAEAPE